MGAQKPVCLATRGHPVTTIRVTLELTGAGQGPQVGDVVPWALLLPGKGSRAAGTGALRSEAPTPVAPAELQSSTADPLL